MVYDIGIGDERDRFTRLQRIAKHNTEESEGETLETGIVYK